MSAESVATPKGLAGVRRLPGRAFAGRTRYLTGALCIAICAVMFIPLVLTVLASLKTTPEAALTPPTYLPTKLSIDSYARLWDYQAGLPKYVMNRSSLPSLS